MKPTIFLFFAILTFVGAFRLVAQQVAVNGGFPIPAPIPTSVPIKGVPKGGIPSAVITSGTGKYGVTWVTVQTNYGVSYTIDAPTWNGPWYGATLGDLAAWFNRKP